ncbi:MAG: hypothetical protein P8080_07335 [Gammaproteobacteria bacterium]
MSLVSELNRRNVFRVAAAYVVLSWVVLQVADVLFEALQLPEVWTRAVLGLLIVGFIPALVFAWVYEMTPEGLKKESEIAADESVTAHTARKLNVVVVVLLAIAVGLFAADRLGWIGPEAPQAAAASSDGETAPAEPSAGTQAPALQDRSVAVLPFVNMSTDAENEYFADGISEEILNLLADVRDLSVASRTSAFGFKGKDTPLPDIARQLDVRYVLEGSVRKAGERVRVTAQLIDAATDRHVWSETYDRRLDDIFAIQDDIAGAIGDALQVELLGASGQRVTSEAIDPDIYAMFLEARHLLRQRSEPALRQANELLIRVVEAEPDFARGHVVLGEAYLLNGGSAQQLVSDSIGRAQARMHAEIARSLNANLGGIYLILGSLAYGDNEPVSALELFGRAIELEPAEPRPYHWRGIVFSQAGHLERARTDLLEAVRLEPGNANASGWLSTIEAGMGHMDRAIELAFRQAELGNPAGFSQAAYYQLIAGDIDAAASALARAAERGTIETRWADTVIAAARDPDTLPRLEQLIATGAYGTGDYWVRYALLALRQYDFLEQLPPDDVDLGAFPTVVWSDPFVDLRRRPWFTEWLSRQGVFGVWEQIGPPEDCRRADPGYACGFGEQVD